MTAGLMYTFSVLQRDPLEVGVIDVGAWSVEPPSRYPGTRGTRHISGTPTLGSGVSFGARNESGWNKLDLFPSGLFPR